jgi:hypothetical protein
MDTMRTTPRERWLWAGGLAAATLLLSLYLSWPLARHAGEGIPSSSRNIEQPPQRYAIPGDHLQLLCHFDLMRDMVFGRIPWFHNVYEFNTGDDGERFRPGAYFFPLSAVYAPLAELMGPPGAWNLTWWLSVWLSGLCMWGWLRRFTADPVAIGLGVLFFLLLPFRWTSLFGGSPSGMALFWVPLTAWGIDIAVREARPWAGAWVGAALLMCFWSDLQVFYFTALASPVFALISLCAAPALGGLPWRRWGRVAPAGLVFLAAMVAYHRWRKGYLTESLMGEGRTIEEVAIFSPARYAALLPDRAVDDTVFIGWATLLALILALSFLCHGASTARAAGRRRMLLFLGLGGVALVTLLLAIGVNSPRSGWLLHAVRARVPFYEMIRQPFKIYAIMPMWLGWMLATGWSAPAGEDRLRRRVRWALAALVALGMSIEIGRSISATICLIQPRQAAYAAVADDARDAGRTPARALVIPLWPGDSADSSLPIYYAHRYDLRLVNGYSPVVSTAYFHDVFRRLESINQGWLENDQADFLLARGVHYVLLHENQFPERVSPFPVGLTRDRLLAHPRLALLAQDGPVSAFRLLAAPADEVAGERATPVRFPTRAWNFSRLDDGPDHRVESPAAHGRAYLRLPAGAAPFEGGPWRVAPKDDLQWLLRLRGDALARVGVQWETEDIIWTELPVRSQEWQWYRVALPPLPGFGRVFLQLACDEGAVEADMGLLLAGDWSIDLPPGEERSFDAADFFHAGHRLPSTQSVRFRPEHDPDVAVFYGPKLPLAAGAYEVEWNLDIDAPAGTAVGAFVLHDHLTGERTRFPVRAGEPVRMAWSQPDEHVVNWIFEYRRVATVDLHRAVLRRRPETRTGQEGSP